VFLVFTATERMARWCRRPIELGPGNEGREEGEVAGQAKALLAVLESRGLRISKKARTHILACTDIEQIDTWLRKAASVASVDELF
jgi:hypothetical protein